MVQDTHDRIVRAALDELGGTEIATQGDSFEIAFLQRQWQSAFASMCRRSSCWLAGQTGCCNCPRASKLLARRALMFSGPRAWAHLAEADEYEAKLHDMSRHLVFKGPASSSRAP